MTLSFLQIQSLVLQHGSPFYLIDRQQFEQNFDALTAAFSSRWNPFILAYSYKTNYIPYLCRLIKDKGGWAEVVSRMEYDLAGKVGCDPTQILFNGPVKRPDDIAMALSGGSLINLDSGTEIGPVLDYAAAHPNQTVRIGLRVNISLSDAAGQSHIQNSLKVGRFGFDPKDLPIVSEELKTADNLNVVSLHGHTSSTDRSVWCFETITQTLTEAAQTVFPKSIESLNIGGGMFGTIAPQHRWCDVPSFDAYAEAVCGVLNQSKWAKTKKPTLIIEPGVAMAANALSFITQVISVKRVGEKTFVTVDGSAFNTKPTFHTLNPPFEVICACDPHDPAQTFDIVGSTCMEKDILISQINAPLPGVGDYLQLENVGAYTVVMTPPFINPAPAILAQDGDRIHCIRRRQTLDDIFAGYQF